ncbi:MAG: LysR family transcriptional regulator [Alphaproteobacteria bacterium]|nr:LysR family transcriptional regulator [Alphaproteobacteria bacterium]
MEPLYRLNLRHLRAVPVIARIGTMGGAASAIGISQPALAQGLAQLERRLATRLFDRLPGGMAATPAGAALAARISAADERLATALARASRRGFNPVNHLGMAQLRAFLALADAGSYAEAAPRLSLSGPALHRAVAEMERLAGQSLVERRGRGVALTAGGRGLARHLRLVVAEYRAGLEAAQPPAGPVRLAIGAMPLSRARLVPAALARLLPAWPGVAVDVVEGAWADLAERLRDGAIDLMIGALRDPAPADLVQWPLLSDCPAVIARAGHPLAGHKAGRAALAGFPWVTGRAGSPLAAQWQALFAGQRPPAPVACGSVMTIRELLLASDCLTLLSPEQVRVELAAGLLVAIDADLAIPPRRIGAVLRHGWQPSPVQRAFLHHLAVVAGIDADPSLPFFE